MANPVKVEMQEMEPNCVVDIIMSRKDCYDIHNMLFDRLFGNHICQWVEMRPNKKELYQDLFDDALDKIKACNPNQRQEQQQQITSTCRSTHIAIEEDGDTPDTNSPCKYMAPYNNFEPQTSDLGIWVPMFMTKEEIFSKVPDRMLLDEKTSDQLSTFIKYINPTYICYRLEDILDLAKKRKGPVFPNMRSAESTVRAWNQAKGWNLKDRLIRAFAAVSCYNHSRQFQVMVHGQVLEQPRSTSQYFDDIVCAMFARLDGESEPDINTKWRLVKNMGLNLSTLAKHLGGEAFLILFPLFELEIKVGDQFLHWPTALWDTLGNLLRSTEMRKFFNSMASTVGIPLVNMCYGGPSLPRHEFFTQLNTIRAQYSLTKVSNYGPRVEIGLSKYPTFIPFWYFNSFRPRRVAPNLSLSPSSLRQFFGDNIEPKIIEYLIRQELPREWEVLGKGDLSRPATKELLLCDYQGIIIPLLIDHGWTLVCYTNPIRSDVDYLIKFIDPTQSNKRYLEVAKMISTWIPKDAPWVPRGLGSELVQRIDSQSAARINSGIHIIIEAIAMAKTGKPESRPLNKQVCKGLRIKYFVHLLNQLQETANKEAVKNAPETTVPYST
ncbi:hypothetical protein F4859DRAFT_511614 [Xylaria cf. heliscus]|nr:hypothetical protein F4859DRAFT_511614 [Xylaria cf. heliscus]